MRAVAGETDIAAGAPDVVADEIGGALHDGAGEIAAGDSGERGAVHSAGDIFYVAGIY